MTVQRPSQDAQHCIIASPAIRSRSLANGRSNLSVCIAVMSRECCAVLSRLGKVAGLGRLELPAASSHSSLWRTEHHSPSSPVGYHFSHSSAAHVSALPPCPPLLSCTRNISCTKNTVLCLHPNKGICKIDYCILRDTESAGFACPPSGCVIERVAGCYQ